VPNATGIATATDSATPTRSTAAKQLAFTSGLGVLVAFIAAIGFFAGLGKHSTLVGVDAALGVPSAAVSVIFFGVVLSSAVSRLAGARYGRAWFVGLTVIVAIGLVFELVAAITTFSWFTVLLAVLAAAALALVVRSSRAAPSVVEPLADRPVALGVFLILAGIAGLTAAMNLTFDDVNLKTTGLKQSCDFSAFAQCTANLHSWEGSLFGFPNPLIGLGAFTVPLVVGIGILFGARFARWFWVAFSIAIALAFVFIGFLIYTSVFVIGTLCVWCALVWTFTIPSFWLIWLYNIKSGNVRLAPRATKFFAGAYTWVPLITLVCYVIVFALFQAQLNVLQYA
jgi:uncharacterized membrane protein